MNIDERIADLQNMIDTQSQDGNWNYDPYMHGLLNGMILSLSVLTGEDPEFLDAPETWLCDYDKLDKFNKSGIIVTKNQPTEQDETD